MVSGKVRTAVCDPLVRERLLAYSYTVSVVLSTIQRLLLALEGSSVLPTGDVIRW